MHIRFKKLCKSMAKKIQSDTGAVYEFGTGYKLWGKWGMAGGATDDFYVAIGAKYRKGFTNIWVKITTKIKTSL